MTHPGTVAVMALQLGNVRLASATTESPVRRAGSKLAPPGDLVAHHPLHGNK